MSLSKDIHIDITLNEMYRIHELILSHQSDLVGVAVCKIYFRLYFGLIPPHVILRRCCSISQF